jgi:hypothetical protein
MALTTMVLFQEVHVFDCRSEHVSILGESLLPNKLLFAGVLTSLVVHIGALSRPVTQDPLSVAPLDVTAWLVAIGVASAGTVVNELHTRLRPRPTPPPPWRRRPTGRCAAPGEGRGCARRSCAARPIPARPSRSGWRPGARPRTDRVGGRVRLPVAVAQPVDEHPAGPCLLAVAGRELVRVALDGRRTTTQVLQHRLGDVGVVVEQVPLGETGLGEEDLVDASDVGRSVAL